MNIFSFQFADSWTVALASWCTGRHSLEARERGAQGPKGGPRPTGALKGDNRKYIEIKYFLFLSSIFRCCTIWALVVFVYIGKDSWEDQIIRFVVV